VSAQQCSPPSLQTDSVLCAVCIRAVHTVDMLFRKLHTPAVVAQRASETPWTLRQAADGVPSASGAQASVKSAGPTSPGRWPSRAPRVAQALRPSPAACAATPAAGAGAPGPAPAVASPPAPADPAAAPDSGSASLLQVRALLARTPSPPPPRRVRGWKRRLSFASCSVAQACGLAPVRACPKTC